MMVFNDLSKISSDKQTRDKLSVEAPIGYISWITLRVHSVNKKGYGSVDDPTVNLPLPDFFVER